MLRLTRAGDYAVRVMFVLAKLPPGQVCPKSVLAKDQEMPGSFLSKILQQLAGAGLIVSHRGVRGGFCLNRDPGDISLLEVMEAVEGPLELNACVIPEKNNCTRMDNCPGALVWKKVQSETVRLLSGISLLAMLKEHGSKPVGPCSE